MDKNGTPPIQIPSGSRGQHVGATASSSRQETCPGEDAGAEALSPTQETDLGQHMGATASSPIQETCPVKHGTPTNDELEELGCSIARKWKKLGRRLSITEERLHEIEHATGNELSEKGYEVLKQWKQQYGPAATYKVLCDALQHKLVERKDLAVKFCYINVNNGTPTDDELEELGCSIGKKWKRLGRRLSIAEEKLDEIEHATGKELSEKGYQVLRQWKQQYGPAATYKVLCDALEHDRVKRKDLAVKFCYINDQHAGAKTSSLPIQESSPGPHGGAIASSPIKETFAGACRKLSHLPQTIPYFVSRVQECSDISSYLCPKHNCRCVLLHGVTGVGKTSTAIKVANDKRDSERLTVVVYVNCRHITSLDDFANKALQQVYHYPVEDPISELKNRLKSQDCYTVLLLDNFEFLLHLGDWPYTPHEGAMAQERMTLPSEGSKIKNFITETVDISRNVKLLVTSSERIVFPKLGQKVVHLACFTKEESYQLLQKVCGERVENQSQCAYQLSEICSGIPLVLYTLALTHNDLLSVVERMSCASPQSTFEFLIKIQSVSEAGKINKCLDICFGRLTAQEKNTLLTLALVRGRFTLPRAEQIFQSLMPRENQLTDSALELAKRSLLEQIVVEGVCVYTFLRVIRDYCRKMETDRSGFREVFVNARNVFIDHFFAFLGNTFRLFLSENASDAIADFRQNEENIMQLVEWCDNGEMTVTQIGKCIDVFNSVGELLAKMIGKKRYESLYKLLRKKSEEMGDQRRLSECLTSLGIKQVFHCSCSPGLCDVAAKQAKEYLVQGDRIQSSPDLSVNTGNSRAQCLSKLGRCLAKEGKFREGREKIQQAIDIRQRHGEEDIVMLAATYNDMAVALSLNGDHQEAIDIRERQTLPIYKERLGDHPFTATILNNLSNNYYALRQYDKAKQYCVEALRMRLDLLKDHRDTAKSLFDLGMVQKKRGELQEAKECLKRSQTMQEKVLDDNIKDLRRTRDELEKLRIHLHVRRWQH